MANKPADEPFTSQQLGALRQRFARMSLTGLADCLLRRLAAMQDGARRKATESGLHTGTGAGVEGVAERRVRHARYKIAGVGSSHGRLTTKIFHGFFNSNTSVFDRPCGTVQNFDTAPHRHPAKWMPAETFWSSSPAYTTAVPPQAHAETPAAETAGAPN